jgi:hypothetical protein
MKFPTSLLFLSLVVCLVSLARASNEEARDLVRERLNRKLSRNRYGEDEQVRIEYGGDDGPCVFVSFSGYSKKELSLHHNNNNNNNNRQRWSGSKNMIRREFRE